MAEMFKEIEILWELYREQIYFIIGIGIWSTILISTIILLCNINKFCDWINKIRKEGDKLVYIRTSHNSIKDNIKEQKNLVSEAQSKEECVKEFREGKPTSKQDTEKSKKKENNIICPECGAHLTENDTTKSTCPYCGNEL